jgi:phospholipid/cholesterol/gamma-HCH transport system substrate-binding protein
MKQNRHTELRVGLFVLLSMAALLFMVLEVANVTSLTSDKHYTIKARFENIGSLKVRSPVKVGGVVIGEVKDITLDPSLFIPTVTLSIDSQFNQFPDTSSVEILTSGLIGEQYVSFVPGFDLDDGDYLSDGDFIEDTKSAIVLEDLIGQFLYSMQGE